MTHSFRLSRRIARLRVPTMAAMASHGRTECDPTEAIERLTQARATVEAMAEALRDMLARFDIWDDEPEPESSEADIYRNEVVRVYAKAKAALARFHGGA